MTLITFSRSHYESLIGGSSEQLDEETARASIRLKLRDQPQTPEDRQIYQQELDQLSALKYISQLKKGKISKEDFNNKVKLVAAI